MRCWMLLCVLWLGCDGATGERNTVTTPVGVLTARSVAIDACNDNVLKSVVLTFSATEDVQFTGANLSGLPVGNGDLVMTATVPADHTFVVRCISSESVPGLQMPSPTDGTAVVDFSLSVDGEALTARVEVPFTTGFQSFDNCGIVLGNVGCTLSDP